MLHLGNVSSHTLDVPTSFTTYSRGKINSYATDRKHKFPYKIGCFNILYNFKQEYLPHKEVRKNKFPNLQSTVTNKP